MSTQPKVLYRYENIMAEGFSTILILIELPITKITPKGVWVLNLGDPRFVLSSAHKRFACPTKKEALESFIARKERQIRILTTQREIAHKALLAAKRRSEQLQ